MNKYLLGALGLWVLLTAGNAFAFGVYVPPVHVPQPQPNIYIQPPAVYNFQQPTFTPREGLIQKMLRENRESKLVLARCFSTEGSGYVTVEIPNKLLDASPNCVPLK